MVMVSPWGPTVVGPIVMAAVPPVAMATVFPDRDGNGVSPVGADRGRPYRDDGGASRRDGTGIPRSRWRRCSPVGADRGRPCHDGGGAPPRRDDNGVPPVGADRGRPYRDDGGASRRDGTGIPRSRWRRCSPVGADRGRPSQIPTFRGPSDRVGSNVCPDLINGPLVPNDPFIVPPLPEGRLVPQSLCTRRNQGGSFEPGHDPRKGDPRGRSKFKYAM